jgi:hypothetical protein
VLRLWSWQSDHSARSHPHSDRSHPHSDRSHPQPARSHPHSARSHPQLVKIHTQSARSHLHSARYHPHLAKDHTHSARSHLLDIIHTRLNLINTQPDLIHTRLNLIHTQPDLIDTRLDLIHNWLDLIHTRLNLIHTLCQISSTYVLHAYVCASNKARQIRKLKSSKWNIKTEGRDSKKMKGEGGGWFESGSEKGCVWKCSSNSERSIPLPCYYLNDFISLYSYIAGLQYTLTFIDMPTMYVLVYIHRYHFLPVLLYIHL